MKLEADSVDEFVDLAKALGMVPAVEVRDAAEALAKQMLAKAGFTVTVAGGAAVPAAEDKPVEQPQTEAPKIEDQKQEVIPPPKKAKRDKPEPLKPDEAKPGEDVLGQKIEGGETLTIADAVAAMRNLAAKKNVEVCRELLKKYDAPKASQVPVDKIAAFVAEANQMAEAA